MKKRLCDINIWQKDWFLELSDKRKLLVKFLFDNCDCAGVYEISWKMLRIFFSEQICREDFAELKQIRFIDENTIFLEDFISFQYGISDLNKLNPNNNVHKGIIKILKKFNLFEGLANPCPTLNEPLANSSLTLSQPLANPWLRVLDKDKDKDKDKDNTSILKEEEIKKEEEKNKDPYELYSRIKDLYISKIGENGSFLNNEQCIELFSLYLKTPDFDETLDEVLEELKRVQPIFVKKCGFSPGLGWLVKNKCEYYTNLRNKSYNDEMVLESNKKEVFQI